MKKIDVLGTEYSILFQTAKENPLLEKLDGFCESSSKNIIVIKREPDVLGYEDFESYQNRVLRHEIIHAFLSESGLDQNSSVLDGPWARNEEMIDWFAIQSPKIFKAFNELGI